MSTQAFTESAAPLPPIDSAPETVPGYGSSPDRPAAAAGVVFLSMFILGGLDNAVSVIARDTGLWQFHFFRACIAVTLMMLLARTGIINVTPKRRWAVALRGGMTGLSMLLYFGSLGFLTLSQAAAGLFTAPIWVMLLSTVFLRQRVGTLRVLAAVIGFAGVVLVLRRLRVGEYDGAGANRGWLLLRLRRACHATMVFG